MQDRINKLGRDIIRDFRRFKPHPKYRTLRRELKNGKNLWIVTQLPYTHIN